MEKFKLDILICGSSRPQLLIYLLESLERFIISQSKNTDFRLLMHEDFVMPEKSEKSVKLAKEWGAKVISHDPPIGYGPAMRLMLNNHIETKYMLNLQDDWEFERTGIDIDRLIWVMDQKKPIINSIIFNKQRNSREQGILEEFKYHGLVLSLSNAWRVLPSIWRTSIPKQKWQAAPTNPAGAFIKEFGGVYEEVEPAINVGAYYLGGLGEERWVRHLGNTWRSTPWGKVKMRLEADVVSITRWKPKWIPYEARPTSKNIRYRNENKERMKELLKQMPENVRKEYER